MTDLTKELPVEILQKIFQFLSFHDLYNVVNVCRRWREVAVTTKLWSLYGHSFRFRNPEVEARAKKI